jgi:hypothetical protein
VYEYVMHSHHLHTTTFEVIPGSCSAAAVGSCEKRPHVLSFSHSLGVEKMQAFSLRPFVLLLQPAQTFEHSAMRRDSQQIDSSIDSSYCYSLKGILF